MKIVKNDLTVVGAGVAGICAALSAARHGLTVALVNDRSVLGGNGSSEIGVPISGACHGNHNGAVYAKEGGIVEEIRMKKAAYMDEGGYDTRACWDAVYFDLIYAEKNISLYLNTTATGARVENGLLTGVYARHLTSEVEYCFESTYYVDSTGNAVVAAAAGATFRQGREAKSEFGEKWAPDTADGKTMGNTFIFYVRDAGRPVKFTAPAYAYDITKMEFFQWIDKKENFRRIGPHGFDWTFEYGGECDIIRDAEDIDKELRCLTMGIWDYVKNSGKFPDAENKQLVEVLCKSGSRESRRVEGDYMLTENDIEQKKDFPDAVAIGGWPMDVHATGGIYDPAPASNFIPVTGTYNIPLRSLYSKDIGNLFLAGRDIGVTHIALGSTRVIATCACTGQAVGTAAAVCKKYRTLPRTLVAEHMEELQAELLWDDQTVLHRKDSLLPGFRATADSVLAYENVIKDGELPAARAYGLALMCESETLESLSLCLRVSRPTTLTVDCLTGIHPETYLPEKREKTVEIPLPATDGWVTLPLSAPRGKDGKVYLVFRENPDVTFYTAEYQPIGAVTHRYHTERSHDCMNHDTIPLPRKAGEYIGIDRTYEEKKNILFKDIFPAQDPYRAESAINGYSRPYFAPNLWQPARLPATLTLEADAPRKLSEIALVFNTRMDNDVHKELPACHTVAYTLTVTASDGQTRTYPVTDNRTRQTVFAVDLPDVKTVTLTLERSKSATPGVFAVKAR